MKKILLAFSLFAFTAHSEVTREEAIAKVNARYDLKEAKKSKRDQVKQAYEAKLDALKLQTKALREAQKADLKAISGQK